jgi:pimeloyl-ACP methyl ester carboxylesterase
LSVSACAGLADRIVLEEIGSFYVEGRSVELQGAEYETQQIYVQYARLANPRHRVPVVLWHGGSLTGATFEATPDGRPGWQSFFLRAGHSVYIVDAFQGGRASWARYPEINPEAPRFRSKDFLWETFRIGPEGSYSRKETFPGSRFPAGAFDRFAMQAVPRFAVMSEPVVSGMTRTFERTGPCILVAHSASAPFAFQVARSRPDLFRALIAVEPSGGIDLEPGDAEALRRIPHLFIWGDNLASESWQALYRSARRYADALGAGNAVTWVDLPARGVRGNSHMLMMDSNSDEIASLMADWVNRHVPH